jgi:hypothetical protein
MGELLRFLQNYELWGYALLGVIAFFYLQKLIGAWNEWRLAIYGLERETAQRRIAATLTVLVLLMLLGIGQFLLVSFIAPVYPMWSAPATPTIDLISTATVTLEPQAAEAGAGNDVLLAPDITTTPSAAEGCIAGELEWTFPISGDEISGTVELRGTVSVLNLGFYKYEYGQPGSDVWLTIAAGNEERVDEPLGGAWNTSQITPGDYLLRLVIADNENRLMAPCVIPVRIVTE